MAITKEEVREAWDKASVNARKLRNCTRHHFDPAPVSGLPLGAKLTCTDCGGTMSLSAVSHYIAGFRAAGMPASLICDGWPLVLPE